MKARPGRLKLNQKFMLTMFCVVLVPVMLLAVILFSNTSRVITAERVHTVEQSLMQVQTGVEKTVDLCNMTTQVFLNSASLRRFLIDSKTGVTYTTQEMIDFYRDEVVIFERLVNSNPYLYQVRVFFDNEDMPELMPILYHTSRMSRLSWAQGEWESGSWQYDYDDTIFPSQVIKPARHIMSLVTAIEDFEHGLIGVLEVSVSMEDLLPGLYGGNGGVSGAFAASNGQLYFDESDAAFWEDGAAAIAPIIGEQSSVFTKSMELGSGPVWFTFVPLSPLGGCFVLATPPGETGVSLTRFRNLFILGMLVLLILLALVVNLIVKLMLRRFYRIFDTIFHLQDGNLAAQVPDLGDDEVGQMGKQINLMIDRLARLMEENVNRQLLAKNSEIRALQSQINAHFIYNVLESIKMMAEIDGKFEMADAIQSLGELLRYSMKWTSPQVTVGEEIENVKNYLALMNLRFDSRVELLVSLPEGVIELKIPKMTLQPIVENAVVHGMHGLERDSVIELSCEQTPAGIALDVTDHGRGIPEDELGRIRRRLDGDMEPGSGTSIGLKNVHDRIVMTCGAGFGIDISSVPGEYTRIRVGLPRGNGEGDAHAHPADS